MTTDVARLTIAPVQCRRFREAPIKALSTALQSHPGDSILSLFRRVEGQIHYHP